ncbi:MAG: hypothetical protein IJ180_09835 [Bacteroidales bacterium]|nr:hypothetical protein [Bacteroidales bacterium]
MKKKLLIYIGIVVGIIILIIVTNVVMRYQRINIVNYIINYPTEDHIISEQGVQDSLLAHFGQFTKERRKDISTEKMKQYLESLNFISRADIAITMTGKLNITVFESEPIVRVYPKVGKSFYIDNDFNVLQVVEYKPSHTMIATGNLPTERDMQKDSLRNVLKDVYDLATLIRKDSILKYQIDQIDLKDTSFILIPKIGDYTILLGNKDSWQDALTRLHYLYKSSFIYRDWLQYSKIDLRFNQQVICTRKEK